MSRPRIGWHRTGNVFWHVDQVVRVSGSSDAELDAHLRDLNSRTHGLPCVYCGGSGVLVRNGETTATSETCPHCAERVL